VSRWSQESELDRRGDTLSIDAIGRISKPKAISLGRVENSPGFWDWIRDLNRFPEFDAVCAAVFTKESTGNIRSGKIVSSALRVRGTAEMNGLDDVKEASGRIYVSGVRQCISTWIVCFEIMMGPQKNLETTFG
jgi:hypothetical protein